MAVGIARAAQIALCSLGCIGLSALAPLPAEGQQEQQAQQAPALSAGCEAPSADIAAPTPLPRVAAALEEKRPVRVLALGSAAASGSTTSVNSYPSKVEAILEKAFKGLDVVMVNRGVSGEVAALTAERLKTQAALERPDLVLWQVGTNDALMRVPIDEFATTVRDTVRWLKERDIDVVLVGLQYTLRAGNDEYYEAMRKALRTIAAEEHVPLVRRFEAMQFIEKAKQGEDTPSLDRSYRCMAEHVAHAIVVSTFMKANPLMRKRQ
jgi:acyl-CoA thioesterase I